MSNDKFIFSIIIAVYNTEKYLAEAIESVINQSFDLERIQIVLVDDGSTDKSTDICLYYQNKYPNNVYYLRQQNAGQSVARNNGIGVASGKYFNFLDSDDKLDLNTLQDVYDLFEKSKDLIDVITIPRYNFGAIEGPMFLNHKYNTTRIVDIEKEFDFPQVAINAAFIRKDALTDRFDPRVVISEDSLLINKTILKKCRYGVVSTARYLYRKRIEQNSTIDTKKIKKEYFIDRMEFYFKELINYSIANFNRVLKYIQAVLMYDVQWYCLDNTHGDLTQFELNQFYKLFKEALQFMDDDIIRSQRYLTPILEHYLLNIKYENPNFEIVTNSNELLLGYDNKFFDNITKHNLIITDVLNRNNLLYIKGFFDTYAEGINLNAYFDDEPLELFKINGEEVYTINKKVSNRIHFGTVLELNEGNNEISFNISVGSYEYPIILKDNAYNYDVSFSKNKLNYNFNKSPDDYDAAQPKLNLIKSEIYNKLDEMKHSDEKLDAFFFEKEILDIDNTPKVSIIIPIFNAGNLLYKCLDSVVNQSLKEIEIVCVDDGSSDNSLEILEKYAKKDSRFKVFHQENQGVGTARNNAINQSEGEFIVFLDADDWIEHDMCKRLYAHSTQLNSDLVIFDALEHTADNKIDKVSYFSRNEFDKDYKSFVFDYKFIKNKLLVSSLGAIWSKFYKSSFIKNNDIRFSKHKIYNDIEFNLESILLADNISYVPEQFYHYMRLGQPSLQTSFREGKDEMIWLDVLWDMFDLFAENSIMDEFRFDFINYCIYYSFDKLMDIDSKYQISFLNQLKSFFKILNPTHDELEKLKTSNMNPVSAKFLPLYHDLVNNDLKSFKSRLLEFKIVDAKINLEKTPNESKKEVYENMRKKFIEFENVDEPITNLSSDLYKFYVSVLNFNTYDDFNVFNREITKKWDKIDKRELSIEIAMFNENGLNLEKRDKKIIVSLTSFPERINDIHYCIYSLLTQNFKPDMVILWLAEEQFPNKEEDLFGDLLKLRNNGLTIKWYHDIGSYKKLIPVLKEYPDDYIVTADDDIFYHNSWLENMWNQYKKFPNTIITSKARRITFNSNNLIDDYANWEVINENMGSSFLNFPIGSGGTLYFPNSLNEKVFDESLFLELCPTVDDVWFWAMAIINKSKITIIDEPLDSFKYINVARESGVLKESTLNNTNEMKNIQMNNVVNKFPKLLEFIKGNSMKKNGINEHVNIGRFASCTSRDAFRSAYNPGYKNNFKIVFDIARCSLISLFEKPYVANENDLIIEPLTPENIERTRGIKDDFQKSFFKKMNEADIDYLIIDEYFEVLFGLIQIDDTFITNNTWDLPHTELYKKLSDKRVITLENNFEEYMTLWKSSCDKFFKYMEQNFPNVKIILNKIRIVDSYMKKDGSIYIDELGKNKAEIFNHLIKILEDYIEENYDIIVIDCTEGIVGDENHIWGKGEVHYNKEYYGNLYREMLKIINADYCGC